MRSRRRPRVHDAVGPPGDEILRPEDPGLAVGAVRDRPPHLRDAVGVAGVVPVETLARSRPIREHRDVMRAVVERRVFMAEPVAPVRDGRVPVDGHGVDGGVGPERIEREAQIAAPVAALRAIFGPVRPVGECRARADDGARLRGERLQRGDGRIDRPRPPHPRQPDEFGADHEAVDAAGRLPERRRMEHEPAQTPVCRPRIDDRLAARREISRRANAEEGRNLCFGRRRAVGRSRATRCRIAGDPPTPGIDRLRRRAGPGIGQPVAVRDIHHHERIERHLQSARLEVPDRPDHRAVRRCPTESGNAVDERHGLGRLARQAGDGPGMRIGVGGIGFAARRDPACAGAQIVAEPGDDQRHMREVRAERLQRVERGMPVRRVGKLRPVRQA